MITVTQKANDQISKLCEENECYAITLDLKGGGCAGFEYEWGTAQLEDLEETHYIAKCESGNLAVHVGAQMFLAGTEIDYVKNLVGQQFEINNPNAQSSCGCGVSVNFDMDKLAIPNE